MKTFTETLKENQEMKHYVDALLINPDDKILILQRAGYMKLFPGKYGFVGGSIENKDKSSKDAIIREIKEETGIELTFNEIHNMKAVDKEKHKKEDGTICSDTEYWIVKLESTPEVKISREHSRYKWIGAEDLNEHNFKFIPDVFSCIQKYFDGDL